MVPLSLLEEVVRLLLPRVEVVAIVLGAEDGCDEACSERRARFVEAGEGGADGRRGEPFDGENVARRRAARLERQPLVEARPMETGRLGRDAEGTRVHLPEGGGVARWRGSEERGGRM